MQKKELSDGTITFKPTRQVKDENGVIIHYMTIYEALTEIMNSEGI